MMAEWDPVLPPGEAGKYCGCSAKTLERLQVERHPIPQTGNARQRWGYRLSVLNKLLDSINDPDTRKPLLRRRTSPASPIARSA